MKKAQIIAAALAVTLIGSLTGISVFAANKQDTGNTTAVPEQTESTVKSTSSANSMTRTILTLQRRHSPL